MSTAVATLQHWARRAVWLLPVWALFLAASTITHQPNYRTDFAAYAEYVTTVPFLLSHVFLSIVGAGLGILGAAGLAVLTAGGARPGSGFRGFSLFTLGNIAATAVFGVAAFFQPAVGRAYLTGSESAAAAINADVYGTVLNLTVVVGMVALVAGTMALSRGASSADSSIPRWATRTVAWSLPPFVLTGIAGLAVQPLFAAALAAALYTVARRLTDDNESLRPNAPTDAGGAGHTERRESTTVRRLVP